MLGLQTVVSRRTDLMKSPTVVSVTMINGGSRNNIVPEVVEMGGTIRTYDAGVRAAVHRDIRQIAENIAASANAKAEVEIIELYDPLVNNERVTARMVPVLERAADGDAALNERSGASEDVSFFLNEIPGLENPTIELMAAWFWNKLAGPCPGLSEIVIHETPTARCAYRGE